MYIPWHEGPCILCVERERDSLEHIIPRSIGGILTAHLLCKPCNDDLGHRIEADVKRDPSIRIAVENLSRMIPDLAAKLTENQPYVAKGPHGWVRGRKKKGSFRVDTKPQPDGSLIQPTDDARRGILKRLAKLGADTSFIQEVLERFDQVPEGVTLDLGFGLGAVKWPIESPLPALDGPHLSDLVLLKISFEFVALHLYTAIYSSYPPIAQLRDSIRAAAPDPSTYRIEHLTTHKYFPLHGLLLEKNQPHAVVRICLFGWLVYRVHLLAIAVETVRVLYEHRLDTNQDLLTKAPEKGAT